MGTTSPPRPRVPAVLAELVRPVSMAGEQILAVTPTLTPLFPESGLRRGTVLTLAGPGATTLALALVARACQQGSWCAAVTMGDLNPRALEHEGLDLGRVVFVPATGGRWGEVLTALVTEVDLVLTRPPHAISPALARRLAAKVRLHRSVLVVVSPGPSTPGGSSSPGASPTTLWAEGADLHFTLESPHWDGIEIGAGQLTGYHVTVTVSGRRAGARPTRHSLTLVGR